jgi:phosphoadenosine phosphosulfate reductase
MLVITHRHTAADLELWREIESADAIHGKRKSLRKKVHASIESLVEFVQQGACYASVSWGKDSVVLAHLVAISEVPIELVHLRVVPTENPHTSEVRDCFLNRYPVVRYRELTKESKNLFADPETRMKAKASSFSRPFREAGLPLRYISGVRGDESSDRKKRMQVFGTSTDQTCAPLGWWSNADVFGYLAALNLPVHPNYGMTGGGRWPREHIRVSELAGEFGRKMGRLEWEREYYGDILARLGV